MQFALPRPVRRAIRLPARPFCRIPSDQSSRLRSHRRPPGAGPDPQWYRTGFLHPIPHSRRIITSRRPCGEAQSRVTPPGGRRARRRSSLRAPGPPLGQGRRLDQQRPRAEVFCAQCADDSVHQSAPGAAAAADVVRVERPHHRTRPPTAYHQVQPIAAVGRRASQVSRPRSPAANSETKNTKVFLDASCPIPH